MSTKDRNYDDRTFQVEPVGEDQWKKLIAETIDFHNSYDVPIVFETPRCVIRIKSTDSWEQGVITCGPLYAMENTMTNYAKASVHPSELREFQDDQTGAHIYQLTNDTSINHNLYFLTSSFTPDQEHLIFTSYRSGKPNFFKLEFPNGDIVQLTDADEVHGYSGVISKDGTELFYTQADAIKAIHLDTFEERVLAEFPMEVSANVASVRMSSLS